MGCACPKGDPTTVEIDEEQKRDKNRDRKKIKLLFLGAGGSGKTTLFKQLRVIYGNGLKENIRRQYANNIYNNIIDGIKLLVEGNVDLASEDLESNKHKKIMIQSCDEKIEEQIRNITDEDTLLPETTVLIKRAWADPGIKATWENRSKLQVQDSLAYFVENIDRISQAGWIPNKDDVLHVRAVTTGITEENMKIKERIFHIVDVGGQRSERRKWIECFADVTGLIYVVSLIAYNQVLYEDESINRMKESMKLFKDTLMGESSQNFEEACVILFLNKDDLFTEMIKNYPITECFPEYKGPLTELDQYNYIRKVYQDIVAPREIFVHRTCATSTDKIQMIFNVVNLEIIRKALNNAGIWLG